MAAWQRLARLRELPLQLMLTRSAGSSAFMQSKVCAFAQLEINLSSFTTGQTRLLTAALHGSGTSAPLSDDSASCNSVAGGRSTSDTHSGTEVAGKSPAGDSSNIGGCSGTGVRSTGADMQIIADAPTSSAAAPLSSGSSSSRSDEGGVESRLGSHTDPLRRGDLVAAQNGVKRTNQWTEQWDKFMDLLYLKGYGANEAQRHDWGSSKRAVLAFSRARGDSDLDQLAAVVDLGALSFAPIKYEDRKVRNARLRLRSYSGVNADGCKATTQLDPAMFGTPSFQDVCRVLMGIQLEEGVLHPIAEVVGTRVLKKVTELVDQAPVTPPPATPTFKPPPKPLPGSPRLRNRAAQQHARQVAKELVVHKQKDRHRQRQLARHEARTEHELPSEGTKGRGQAASSGRVSPQSPARQGDSGRRGAGARPGFRSEPVVREGRGSSQERPGRQAPTQSSDHSGRSKVGGRAAGARSGSGASWQDRGRGRGGPSRSQQDNSTPAGRSAW